MRLMYLEWETWQFDYTYILNPRKIIIPVWLQPHVEENKASPAHEGNGSPKDENPAITYTPAMSV